MHSRRPASATVAAATAVAPTDAPSSSSRENADGTAVEKGLISAGDYNAVDAVADAAAGAEADATMAATAALLMAER